MEHLSPYYIPDISETISAHSSTHSLTGRDSHKAYEPSNPSCRGIEHVSPSSRSFWSDTHSWDSGNRRGSISALYNSLTAERTPPSQGTKQLEPTHDEVESQTVPISRSGCCPVHCIKDTPKLTAVRNSKAPGKPATSRHRKTRPAPVNLGESSFGSTSKLLSDPEIDSIAKDIGRDLALQSSNNNFRPHRTHTAAQESRPNNQPRPNLSEMSAIARSLVSPGFALSQDFLARSPMSPTHALPLQHLQAQTVSHSPSLTRKSISPPSSWNNSISPRDLLGRPSGGLALPSSPLRNIVNNNSHLGDIIAVKQGPPLESFCRASKDLRSPRSIGRRSIGSRKSLMSQQSSVHSETSRFSDSSVHGLRGKVKALLYRVAEKL